MEKKRTGLLVLDIDDCIVKANKDIIGIWKQLPDGTEIRLSTEEFAKDPDSKLPNSKQIFDIREFRDPEIVYNSILKGTPFFNNLHIMDVFIRAGFEICFLTGRGLQDVVCKAIQDFLLFRDWDGELKPITPYFRPELSAAVNDETYSYEGDNDADKKGKILVKLCEKYDEVCFIDDDKKNIDMALSLGRANLTVIKV
jgi:hypothetical protein